MNDYERLVHELFGIINQLEDPDDTLDHVPAHLRSIAQKIDSMLPPPYMGELIVLEDFRN